MLLLWLFCDCAGRQRSCTKQHIVVSGDTCAAVLVRYLLSPDNLTALNLGLDCSSLQDGQQLCVSTDTPPPNEGA